MCQGLHGFLSTGLEKNINYKKDTMEFNGTVIITDPYFISGRADWGTKFCTPLKDGKSGIGHISEDLGFGNYIFRKATSGDGKWKVSELDTILGTLELEEFIERIEEAYENFFKKSSIENEITLETLIRRRNTIGRFYSDSGCYGVFLLDDVLRYNSDFLTKYGNWCYTIVPDFIGDIEVYDDSNNNFHIIGVGNKTFYSNTMSWL